MKRWSGVIAIEGIETRDGRIIDEFVWDPGLLPMNFSCQFLRAEGHDGADVTSANMTEITRVGNQILASGYYMDTPAGNMAAMLLGAGTLTAVSVTGGKVEDYRWELLDQNGNLVTDEQYMEMPAEKQALCRSRQHFGRLEIAGLTQVDVSAFPGARIALVAEEAPTRLVASAAGVAGHNPEWFKKLAFAGPTRLQITADRRIFGHVATRDQCHRSFTDRCVNLDYNDDLKDFHNGTALLTTGELISAKGITCADLHAPDGNFSYDQIQHIIEDTGLQFGVVRAYIDEYGIQLCGVAFSDVPEPTLDRVRAGTPSVDARRKAGAMKLFGVHVVTTGGLPVEVDEDEDGRMLRMVASAAEGLDMGPDVTELALADDGDLDSVVPPCDCAELTDDISVPEFSAVAPAPAGPDVDLEVAVSDSELALLDSDLALLDLAI